MPLFEDTFCGDGRGWLSRGWLGGGEPDCVHLTVVGAGAGQPRLGNLRGATRVVDGKRKRVEATDGQREEGAGMEGTERKRKEELGAHRSRRVIREGLGVQEWSGEAAEDGRPA